MALNMAPVLETLEALDGRENERSVKLDNTGNGERKTDDTDDRALVSLPLRIKQMILCRLHTDNDLLNCIRSRPPLLYGVRDVSLRISLIPLLRIQILQMS